MSGYTILKELGRGGMGVVHLARQEALGRDVALKTLLPAHDEDGLGTKRFLREIRALMALQHPNVVRVFDCGELDGQTFYAMELIAGQPLSELLEAGPLPRARALAIARQAAQALAACHAAGLVHRDVKAENLMVGASDHVTLMDFGLVRVEGGTVFTVTGSLVGTPSYLAPETLQQQPAGKPADVYALGVLLTRMLAGRIPFEAQHLAAMLVEILHKGPLPLATLCPDTPAPLAELVRAMVQKDPAARPSMDEVVSKLREVAGGAPSGSKKLTPRPSRPVKTIVSTPPPPPPRARWPALVAIAVVAAAAGLGLSTRDGPRPPASPSPTVVAEAPPVAVAATAYTFPGERALGVRVMQDGAHTFEVHVERVPDGKRVWTARAGPGRVTYFVARGLAPATGYRVRLVTQTKGLVVRSAPIPATTRAAGWLAQAREQIARGGEVATMAVAADVAAGSIDCEPEVTPALIKAQEQAEANNDGAMVVFCARSLGFNGDPAAVPAVLRALRRGGTPTERDHLCAAAGRLAHPAVMTALIEEFPKLSAWEVDDLALMFWCDRDRTVAHVRAVLEAPEKFPKDYVHAIAMTCSREPVDELAAPLTRALRNPDLAWWALHGLTTQSRATGRRALEDVLRFHASPPEPRWTPDQAFRFLVTRFGASAELSPLIGKLSDSAGNRVIAREWSARVLGSCAPVDAEARLVRLLADADPGVRRWAALSLARLGTRGAADALLARLPVETQSLGRLPRALGLLREPRAADPLLALVARPASPLTTARPPAEIDRAEALWALGQLKDPRARAPAEAALESRVDYVRFRAAEALGWLGSRESLPALARAAARSGELEIVKEAALRAAAWIEKGGAPADRGEVLDAADETIATGRDHGPGASVPARVVGAWARDASAPLRSPSAPQGEGVQPRLAVRAGTGVAIWGDRDDESCHLWRGGPLWWEVWNTGPEAIGFQTVWLE